MNKTQSNKKVTIFVIVMIIVISILSLVLVSRLSNLLSIIKDKKEAIFDTDTITNNITDELDEIILDTEYVVIKLNTVRVLSNFTVLGIDITNKTNDFIEINLTDTYTNNAQIESKWFRLINGQSQSESYIELPIDTYDVYTVKTKINIKIGDTTYESGNIVIQDTNGDIKVIKSTSLSKIEDTNDSKVVIENNDTEPNTNNEDQVIEDNTNEDTLNTEYKDEDTNNSIDDNKETGETKENNEDTNKKDEMTTEPDINTENNQNIQETWFGVENAGYFDIGMEVLKTSENSFRTKQGNIDITIVRNINQTCGNEYTNICNELAELGANYNSVCLYNQEVSSDESLTYTYNEEAYMFYIPSEYEDMYMFLGTCINPKDSVTVLISGYEGCDKELQKQIAIKIAESFY